MNQGEQLPPGTPEQGPVALAVRPVVVCGVAGSGKTTLGQVLAARLGARFLDADDFHPAANVAKMRSGTALDDADRAPWLAVLNQQLRDRIAAGEPVVLACSALKSRYRVAIAQQIPVIDWIFLDGDAALIAQRMRERSGHYMPESLLQSQFEALERPQDAISIAIELSCDEQVRAALAALGRSSRADAASG